MQKKIKMKDTLNYWKGLLTQRGIAFTAVGNHIDAELETEAGKFKLHMKETRPRNGKTPGIIHASCTGPGVCSSGNGGDSLQGAVDEFMVRQPAFA